MCECNLRFLKEIVSLETFHFYQLKMSYNASIVELQSILLAHACNTVKVNWVNLCSNKYEFHIFIFHTCSCTMTFEFFFYVICHNQLLDMMGQVEATSHFSQVNRMISNRLSLFIIFAS